MHTEGDPATLKWAEKCEGLLCSFSRTWGAGSPFNNVAWAEAYIRTKWYPDPSSRCMATVDMVRVILP